MNNDTALNFGPLAQSAEQANVEVGAIYSYNKTIGAYQRVTRADGSVYFTARLFADGIHVEFDTLETLMVAVDHFAA